jgi:hypothetical protein
MMTVHPDFRRHTFFLGLIVLLASQVAVSAGDIPRTPNPTMRPTAAVQGRAVSYRFFREHAVRLVLGRSFVACDVEPSARPVAIISYDLWQTRLMADPNVIGRTLEINGRSFTIIGVLPKTFSGHAARADVFVPLGVMA